MQRVSLERPPLGSWAMTDQGDGHLTTLENMQNSTILTFCKGAAIVQARVMDVVTSILYHSASRSGNCKEGDKEGLQDRPNRGHVLQRLRNVEITAVNINSSKME